MKLEGKTLCNTYPKMIHLTCLAHAMHNVCENITKIYKSVNRLVSCGKKIFLKSQSRKQLFKDRYPLIPLPPEPVKTRWGSWIYAIEYYAKYYLNFKTFVNSLDANESIHIIEAQELLEGSSLECDLAYINANFNCLAQVIKKIREE
jgi:hypothetical protein